MRLYVQNKDFLLVSLVAVLQALASIILLSVAKPATAIIASIFSALVLFCLCGLYFLRREQAYSIYDKNVAANYWQIESLFRIYSSLDLTLPLPEFRHYRISPDAASHLIREIILRRPKVVVECGSGLSTVLIGKALQKNREGKVYSIEGDLEYAEISRKMLTEYDVDGVAQVIKAPIVHNQPGGPETPWYEITRLSDIPDDINLLFVDGPVGGKGSKIRYPALGVFKERLAKDAVLLLDDYIRTDEQEIAKLWLEQLPGYELIELPAEKGFAVLKPSNSP